MNASIKSLAFLAVALLGLYGCAKAPTISQSSDDRGLREKIQKLETENQAIVAARDQYRQKLLKVEKDHAAISQELSALRESSAREVAALTEQLKSRTAERDTIQVQYDGFRKTIREVLGQAEAALPLAKDSLARTSTEAPSPRN